jgi:orotate phosphoribosyltransferase
MSKNPIGRPSQAEFLKLLNTRQGHFRFESGHHGNLWLDLDLLLLSPKRIEPFVTELARKISSFGIDAVCGPMVGGALIAQNIALALGVDFLYTERIVPQNMAALYPVIYSLPGHLRTLVQCRSLAIVDDVINAGSAIRGTHNELESLGARTVVIGALLVLGEAGAKYFAERDLPVQGVSYLPNEIWAPENCPLCSSQIPLDDQG